MIISFWKRQINEIGSSRALMFLGAGLSFTHVLTFLYWFHPRLISQLSNNAATRVCWPALPCDSWPEVSEVWVQNFFFLYLFMASISVATFLFRKAKSGCLLLLFTVFLKILIFVQDARLMGNYHYMPFWATFAFLFIPGKIRTLKILMVGFYLQAGVLKINREWLSGGAIPESFVVPWLRPILYMYDGYPLLVCALWVVILELICVWGLLLRGRIAWFAFVNFIIFHVFSFGIVGYFYPGVMACMLILFPLSWWEKNREWWQREGKIFVAVFALLQIHPWLIGKAPAITGEGRWYSLNMFDAAVQCDSQIFLRKKNGDTIELFGIGSGLAVRIGCDPYYYYTHLVRICEEKKQDPDFLDLDFFLQSRKASDKFFRSVVMEKNFCQKKLTYSSVWPNAWIK